MCDFAPGELIVSYPRAWNVSFRGFPQANYLESMEDKLERHGLWIRDGFPLSLHLLKLEPGEENYLTGALYNWFAAQRYPGQPQIGPNYRLSVGSAAPSTPTPTSAKGFTFGPSYSVYKTMTGLPHYAGNSRRVLIIDTGLASDHYLAVHASKNILDPTQTAVDDDNGHGTAVALVIADLAPNDEFIIYKAADAAGKMNEWDLLAAIAADSGANVVNLSVEYGLALRSCSTCGRQSSSSRSTVFEKVLDTASTWSKPPVITAAAGNGRGTKLAYPARFADILAAGSVNSRGDLAQPSNSGNSDHRGHPHQNHFAAPGGDADPSTLEHVIELASGVQYRGTSFACAFASATVLAAIDTLGTTDPARVLSHLRANADKTVRNYSTIDHGNGVIHVWG